VRNFSKLLIWKKAVQIAIDAVKLAKTLPQDERFGLAQQISRSGISIPSNIAEGSSRSSEKENYHFQEIALGSCFELETQVLIAESVNYGHAGLRNAILQNLTALQKMLYRYMGTLNK